MGNSGDFLGRSVGISGNKVILGAPQDDDEGNDSGSAYIFERRGDGTWYQATKLFASDGVAQNGFGRSVAISEDRVVVGTDHILVPGNAAYVFERKTSGTWVEVEKLVASDPAATTFGRSVAVTTHQAIIGEGTKHISPTCRPVHMLWLRLTENSNSRVRRHWG